MKLMDYKFHFYSFPVIYYYLTNRNVKNHCHLFQPNIINCDVNIKCAPFKRILEVPKNINAEQSMAHTHTHT